MEHSGHPLHNLAAEDHHCHDHAHFVPTCESCRRARAAFLPYQNVDPHPQHATRSFQTNLGSAFPPDVSFGLKEWAAFGVAEGVAEGVTDGIIDLLLDRER